MSKDVKRMLNAIAKYMSKDNIKIKPFQAAELLIIKEYKKLPEEAK